MAYQRGEDAECVTVSNASAVSGRFVDIAAPFRLRC
jgi:hypothetical protein